VGRYVVTITPDNGTAAAHTTVRVDTSSGQTRVTELTVEAGSGAGLAPADLPPIDLDLLVRALTAPVPARTPAQTRKLEAPSNESVVGEPTEPAPRRRGTTGARAKKAAVAKKTTAKKATVTRAGVNKAAPVRKVAAKTGTRAYRRMPEPEQVMDVYRQTGSVTAVAEHFDVPRHTVAGWARRLRTLGYAIGRS
jgi:hypothetical protein